MCSRSQDAHIPDTPWNQKRIGVFEARYLRWCHPTTASGALSVEAK